MNDTIADDPNWWPHRFDPVNGHVHYIKATRDDHRKAVFLTDEYLKNAANPKAVKLGVAASASKQAPIHFIFHSAYCCSTLLARAFDLPSISMGLKEPQILNDLAGWRSRGARPEDLSRATAEVLSVLSRPFEPNETVIVKPSNVVNGLAEQILHLSPKSNALFLYAPLQDFLGSIARKGMWGRLWVRDLMVKQLRDGMINLGLEGDDYLRLTDLQTAAVGWLVQHALFKKLVGKYGGSRIKTLDSKKLMQEPEIAMQQLIAHFGVTLEGEAVKDLVSGPVFTRHSKTDAEFNANSREEDQHSGDALHSEEIEKVSIWAEAVAKNVGLSMKLPSSLI